QAPIMFYGAVTLNDANASSGTAINASIDGKLCGRVVTTTEGRYHKLAVTGNESDDGETITFTVCGATAGTAVWHASITPTLQELDLTAVDDEAPAATDANASPTSIVADGVETTQLNVTVIDGCRCTVGTVTANLSAIGGDDAQEMTYIEGTDIYTVKVTAAESTPPGAYCLYVNASDVFGNCNTSVCIDLVIKDVEAPVISNPDADPASIVADGTETSQLSVTVVDDSDIDFVTVDLSAIGGSAVQVMESSGGDIYSTDTNASMDTPPGTYYLYINASDVFGNYDDTSVCIELEIETTTYAKGDLDHNGQVADAVDVAMMLQASVGDITATSEYDLDGNGQNADAVDVAMMLQASVGDITL
ncbi:MAG: hypothetical protein U9Q37_08540, partial [Euryarchaeota archaeon]|nr:hypothetical protein [Euryarchaeota archaeon]